MPKGTRSRTAVTVPQLVRREITEARRKAHLRQEDVAQEAQVWGLDWTRSVVASLEAGVREVRAEELLLLPVILSRLTGSPVGLLKMFSGPDELQLTNSVSVLPGHAVDLIFRPEDWMRHPSDPDRLSTDAVRVLKDTAATSETVVVTDADRDAAKRLGVDLGYFLRASRDLWGRTYSEERDARALSADEDVPPRAQQAKRAHASRKLDRELAELVAQRKSNLEPAAQRRQKVNQAVKQALRVEKRKKKKEDG